MWNVFSTLVGWVPAFAISVFVICSSVSRSCSCQSPELFELRKRLESFTEGISQMSLRSRSAVVKPVFNDEGRKEQELSSDLVECRPCTDGLFWKFETEYPGRDVPYRQITEYKVESDGSILSATSYLNEKGENVYPTEDGVGLLLSDPSLVAPETMLRSLSDLRASAPYLSILYGWLPGGSFDSYFDSVETVQRKVDHSVESYVCVAPKGTLSVSFASDVFGSPLKISLIRKANDYFGDGGVLTRDRVLDQMRQFPGYVSSPSDNDWAVRKVSNEWTFSNIMISRSGHHFPSSVGWREVTEFVKSPTETREAKSNLRENSENGPRDCDFTFEVPIHADVTVQGGSQLAYHWNGEKAVPTVPSMRFGVSNLMRGNRLQWLVLLNTFAVGIMLSVYLVRRCSKHS